LDATDAHSAVRSAIDQLGHIDVFVNNAGNFFAGFFEQGRALVQLAGLEEPPTLYQ
jgi:NADP-dependent 3-hydroxy acid dehydrogenase YdfG